MTSVRAQGTFDIKAWDEETWQELAGGDKLTRAHVTRAYTGDLQGAGRLEYLTAYRGTAATFVGFEQVDGTLRGRRGSFVLQHAGTYADGVARSTYTIVPDSGTGELQSLRGSGTSDATSDATPYALDYELG